MVLSEMEVVKMVYAKQIAPEYQESPLFLGEDFFPDNIAVCGNRDYCEHLPATFEKVREVLTAGELAEMLEDPADLKQWYRNATEAITDYLPPDSGNRYSTKAIHELKALVIQFSTCHSREENRILCAVLSIVTGQIWEWGIIRGCCQSDRQEIFYPAAEWNKEAITAFETAYFNTGTEWIIHDEDTEPESPEEVIGYSVYCVGWNDEHIKRELADAAGESDPAAVVLFKFTGWSRCPEYERAV